MLVDGMWVVHPFPGGFGVCSRSVFLRHIQQRPSGPSLVVEIEIVPHGALFAVDRCLFRTTRSTCAGSALPDTEGVNGVDNPWRKYPGTAVGMGRPGGPEIQKFCWICVLHVTRRPR